MSKTVLLLLFEATIIIIAGLMMLTYESPQEGNNNNTSQETKTIMDTNASWYNAQATKEIIPERSKTHTLAVVLIALGILQYAGIIMKYLAELALNSF